MDVGITRHGRIVEVKVTGRLSSAVADAFDGALCRALDDGAAEMVVDMTQLAFISSSGLRALIVAARRLNADGGKIHLFGLNDAIREVFDISGLFRVFLVHDTREEAMAITA